MRKKLFITLLALVCVLCCMFSLVACSLFGNKEPDGNNSALPAPKNVSFDKDTYTLSWDKVDNAAGYTISYNDSFIRVGADKTSEQVLITAEQNSFKVKAVGDDVKYVDSGWSKEIKYNIELNSEQSTTFEKVNIELAKLAKEKDLELKKVIGISYVNPNGTVATRMFLRFETLCEKGHVLKKIQFIFSFSEKMSVAEMMINIDSASRVLIAENEIINYNSAQCMLDGNALDGNMLELKNQGYDISVVDSIVTKGDISGRKLSYVIIGTYKAEKGGEIKYFTSAELVVISLASTDEKENYEQCLLIPQMRTVKEIGFVMHEETMEYIGELVKRSPLSVCIDGIYYSIIGGRAALIRPDRTITEANIPASFTWQNNVYTVTSIAEDAFDEYLDLTSITVDENNAYYASHDGLLYNKAKTRLIRVPQKVEGEVTIPNGVTSIGDNAFRNCNRITSITIPGSVKSIGSDVFYLCTQLASIELLDGVTSIEDNAFRNCEALTGVTIPGSVKSIGSGAFYRCISLTSVELPDGVTTIGYDAFEECRHLTSITIPGSVKSFGDRMFSGCSELTSIKFNGTKARWKEIQNHNHSYTVGEYIVTCTDGKLDKNLNEITE